ncbi:hypothetical protein C0Q70_16928 [Pomacea canaliculata]|uniref:Uncharacterized protein n=1 Tax=Pomacea canaliculata TaxID=400727 RepID=A0A2T7NR50_POMCA|nr:hypothetical protein C0Q70_16928 [Pomacea canaliculata]
MPSQHRQRSRKDNNDGYQQQVTDKQARGLKARAADVHGIRALNVRLACVRPSAAAAAAEQQAIDAAKQPLAGMRPHALPAGLHSFLSSLLSPAVCLRVLDIIRRESVSWGGVV